MSHHHHHQSPAPHLEALQMARSNNHASTNNKQRSQCHDGEPGTGPVPLQGPHTRPLLSAGPSLREGSGAGLEVRNPPPLPRAPDPLICPRRRVMSRGPEACDEQIHIRASLQRSGTQKRAALRGTGGKTQQPQHIAQHSTPP